MLQFRVIIAEDEPPAARYIKTLVEEAGGFTVTALCEDGEEALEEIEKSWPDVLISDIKMDGMTGLELIREARKRNPQLITVIISGYKMFEYAQEGIKLNIADYLLKPIDRDEMERSLGRIREQLLQDYREKRRKRLEFLFLGGMEEEDAVSEISSYFPYPYFRILLLHSNGKTDALLEKAISMIKKMDEGTLCAVPYKNSIVILEGVEKCEEEAKGIGRIETMCSVESGSDLPIIRVLDKKAHPTAEMIHFTKQIYAFSKQQICFGRNACVIYSEDPVNERIRDHEDRNLLDDLKTGIYLKNPEQAKLAFKRLCGRWESKGFSVYDIKRDIYEIFGKLHRMEQFHMDLIAANEQLDECIRISASLEEFCINIWEFFQELINMNRGDGRDKQKRAEKLFMRIQSLIEHNMDHNYSLQEISDLFGVSQPYISRLFRTYAGSSYKEYVLKMKIDIAMGMMNENPAGFVKDIAEKVGFDQLYFSTVFRRITGQYPSQYREQLKGKNP